VVVLGEYFKQAFKLRGELYQYLTEENQGSADIFKNSDLIMKLA
jgi:hypothetical protein